MTGSVPHAAPYAAVTAAEPSSPEARAVLTAYFRDIVSRYHRRKATPDEVGVAMAAEPSDDLCPPHGLFLQRRPLRRSLVRETAELSPCGERCPKGVTAALWWRRPGPAPR
jgi:hypothetical protein